MRSGLVAYHDDLDRLLVDIDAVGPHPENYNNGDIDKIVDSIEHNGMYRPVYVQRSTGWIIAGNHTWYACKQLDAEQIPVVYLDIDDNRAKAIMVADNHLASLARPDPGLMLNLLQSLEDAQMRTDTGVDDREMENLKALAENSLDAGFATWPMIVVKVPPHVHRAFYAMTDMVDEDRARFEMLMEMAGWDGKDPR